MKLHRIYLVLPLLGLLIGTACSSDASTPQENAPQGEQAAPVSVVTTIYPMGYFAERIGGSRVTVTNLVPAGVEAHAFELTPREIQRISEADLVVINGLGMEPWIEEALKALGGDLSGTVVEAALEHLAMPFEGHDHGHEDHEGHEDEDHEGHEDEDHEGHGHEDHEGHEDEDHEGHEDEDHEGHEDEDHEGHEDEDHEGHEDEDHEDEDHEGHEDEDHEGHEGHGHGSLDPHLWLDPVLAKTQAERILDALVAVAPTFEAIFRDNAAALIRDINALHTEFEVGLRSCAHDEFVTSHAAYGYLANRYGLEQIEIAGLSPSVEPSAQRLAEIADTIEHLGLRHVLIEPVLSGRLERTLARETGAGVLTIHPLGSVTAAELEAHGDYLGIMRDTLANLRLALDCAG